MDDKKYAYGMRERGFSLGCQPMAGLIGRVDDMSGEYYDILVYSRKLTPAEVRDFELEYLGEVE